MRILLIMAALLYLSGCANLGVPVSLCDAQDEAICRAELAAEIAVNRGVDLADESACVDLDFICADRNPVCPGACDADPGAGDFAITRVPVALP